MPISRHAGVLLVLTVVSAPAMFAGEPEPRDPIRALVPETFPEFRGLVTGPAFKERMAAVLKQAGGLEALDRSNVPEVGLRLTLVNLNGSAWRAGMRVGDILTKIDEERLWTPKLPRKEQAQGFEFYSQQGKNLRTVEIAPGKVGIKLAPHWRPELAWLRGTSRGAWDAEAVAGVLSASSDPDLAETCWRRAIEKGHPRNSVAAAGGIEIALAQGRPDVATAFAHFARKADAERGEIVNPVVLYRAAIADFQLHNALEVASKFAAVFEIEPEVLQELIDLHSARGEAERRLPPPSVMAAGCYRDSLLPRLNGMTALSIEKDAPPLRAGGRLEIEADLAHFREGRLVVPEPTPDLDVTVRFSAELKSGDDGGFVKEFELLLQDGRRPPDLPADYLGLAPAFASCRLRENSVILMTHNGDDNRIEYPSPGMKVDLGTIHEWRVVRVAGRQEMFLDGRRLLYVPVADTGPVRFNFRIVGGKAAIHSVKMDELIERP